MTLEQLLDYLRTERGIAENITHWQTIPARRAVTAEYPDGIDERLKQVLAERGITKLYSHQAEAVRAVLDGRDTVIVTPTASGKTLCYNLPTLNHILKEPNARALYLFPTKALSQDQLAELMELVERLEVDIKTYTFDGDTPVTARRAIRAAGHIVVTNPDMLHAGILPHHT
ncbi:MAG: DEAD/DEAH box helicase, partial [Candidatus Zixiibacteriota bacterium]